tara:strand:+ start:926 stop:1048 length:123 start_codon:yes stop_codon:yes gene_type:complete
VFDIASTLKFVGLLGKFVNPTAPTSTVVGKALLWPNELIV